MVYTPGCYRDGKFGHWPTRKTAANFYRYIAEQVTGSYNRGMVDGLMRQWDTRNYERRVCYELNILDPHESLRWGWRNGDFGLWEEASLGPDYQRPKTIPLG